MDHDWQRFWTTPDSVITLADQGFLPDPTGSWLSHINQDIWTFEQISAQACLILLGEPGMGKSRTMAVEAAAVTASAEGSDDRVLHVDLASTRDEATLRSEIFDSQEFIDWSTGTGTLHLFLDSLDEAVLRLGVVADIILKGIRGTDTSRLRLRIACRTADRLPDLERRLSELWAPDQFGVFELAPLRKADVRRAAEDYGQEADEFVRQLIEGDMVPLGIKPISLGFLLDAASGEGGLPTSQLDLYDRGLRKLAAEPGERRDRDPTTSGEVDVGKRMAIASRIAGATLLTGRPTIVRNESAELSANHALVRQLAGGTEPDLNLAIETRFEVSTAAVEEVLASGLFSARGDDLGWAHQTYGEFLAARYLTGSGMSTEKIVALLVTPDDPDGRIVPQLRDVAAWAAIMDPAVMNELVTRDPLVLLRGDVRLADAEQKAALTSALLRAGVAEELDKWDPRHRRNLRALNHPDLAVTLRSRLTDRNQPQFVRELACEIAELTELTELQNVLIEIACDSDEPVQLRTEAVRALDRIADDEARLRLVPLASTPLPEDAEDELKGSALRAVCPRVVAPTEVFAYLSPQKRENLYGSYAAFLGRSLIEALAAEDLPAALGWVRRLPRQHNGLDELSAAAERILEKAWNLADEPQVLAALAETVAGFLEGHYPLQTIHASESSEAFQEEAKRRQLVESIVPMIRDGNVDAAHMVNSRPPLLLLSDIQWLATRLTDEVGTEDEHAWAELVEWTSLYQGADLAPVMEAREQSSILKELTVSRFGPIELGSELAEALRVRHERYSGLADDERRAREEAPDMDAFIDAHLAQFENGDLDAFWKLNLDLWVEQGGRFRKRGGSDLTMSDGWQRGSPERQARIGAAAEEYLVTFEPEDDWFDDPQQGHFPSQAGFRALRYALEHRPDLVTGLDPSVLARWIPAILTFTTNTDTDDESRVHEKLVQLVRDRCPEDFSRQVRRRVIAEAGRDGGHLVVLWRLRGKLRGDLGQSLLDLWQDEELQPQAEEDLLRGLLREKVPGTEEAALSLLKPDLIRDDPTRAHRLATAVLACGRRAAWDHLWPLIQGSEDWGAGALQHVAGDDERTTDLRSDLLEDELADLFLWLSDRFPREQDPDHTGAHFVGPREEVAHYRDRILAEIASRGTDAAIEALLRIETATGLRVPQLRVRAREARRNRSWDPPRPEDIIGLAADARRRVVLSEADLQHVVLESLDRAQEKLTQGEAHLLWDTQAKQPKSETEIAAWIASHLRDDLHGRGIIINREVEIRVNPQGGVGDRTDIHVDALAGELVEGAERITVVIEVKGCWNRDLPTAQRTQLADNYLPASGTRHGIYLPVWFAANDRWDKNWRRDICSRLDRLELQHTLEAQAEDIMREQSAHIVVRILDGSLSEPA